MEKFKFKYYIELENSISKLIQLKRITWTIQKKKWLREVIFILESQKFSLILQSLSNQSVL